MSKHSNWATLNDVEASNSPEKARRNRFSLRNAAWTLVTVGLIATGVSRYFSAQLRLPGPEGRVQPCQVHEDAKRLENFQQCAIDNLLETGLPFLEKASPINVADFEERRQRLAEALVAEEADAFVVEPGYTFKYYGNVSQPEWEVWEVSESPGYPRYPYPTG